MTYKSTVEEIRQRFDSEFACYTNLETGQVSAVDSVLALDLIAEAAAVTTANAKTLLDLGCGGGNASLKVLEKLPGLDVTLVDLSRVMLDQAVARVSSQTTGAVSATQSDMRHYDFGHERFDIVVASVTLHHLRTDDDWNGVFQHIHDALKPGGSFWIFDIVESPRLELQALHWRRYGEYLTSVGGDAYREELFARIIEEDTPRSVPYQLELLRKVGFKDIELLHKNSCYAAFGAMKLLT